MMRQTSDRLPTYHVLIERYAVYARTAEEHRAKPPLHPERWTELQAGSRGQAMGMGWQLRNVPKWQPNYK